MIIMNMYVSDIQNPINLLDNSELTAYLEDLGDSIYYSATVSAGPSDANSPKHELYFISPLNEKKIFFLDNSFDSKFDFLATYGHIKSEEEKRLTENPEELKASRVSEIYETGIDTIESGFREHKVKAGFSDLLFNIAAKIRPSRAEEFTLRKGINSHYLPVFIEEILRQDKKKHPLTDVRDFINDNDPPYYISAYDVGLKPDLIVPLKI